MLEGKTDSTARKTALVVKDLRKNYGDLKAVDGIDLEVYAGECFGLLGPNGAGKTTTIEICEGLTSADSGEVTILGKKWDEDSKGLRERLGIQLQETQLAEKLTVRETIELFQSFYRTGRAVDEVMDLVSLQEKSKARVNELSGGQKQRLALACSLIGDPDIIFLDEPTTGLDPQSRRQLWELVEELKSAGKTILLTTHYMDEAERLCDRIAIVDKGKVIALGTPRELIVQIHAEQIVFFSVEDPDSVPVEAVNAIDSKVDAIRGARRVNGGWELMVSAPHESIPALLSELQEQGLKLTELRTHSPTLEDVFVSLTGRALRDV